MPGTIKYWEIIADRLSKSGWSWDAVTAVKDDGKPVFIANARSADDKHFIVRADEELTAFLDREQE